MAAYIKSRVDGGLRAVSARYAALNPQPLLVLPRNATCAGFLTLIEEWSTSTTSLVSTRAEGSDLIGGDDPLHQILEQPDQDLTVRGRKGQRRR